MIKPFNLNVPQEVLDDIFGRVRNYPWSKMSDLNGWEFGSNLNYMKELCAYWIEEFDWRKQEVIINQFNHFFCK